MMYYGTFIVEREVNFCACYVEKNCKKGMKNMFQSNGLLHMNGITFRFL